ncbi:MAG: ATP-binding cassette domain-containing protein [Porcipelethomonas sp.]
MVKSADCFFRIVFGIIAVSAAFYSMQTIDVFWILFLIFPILGNFVFGRLMNKVWTGRYMDNVKHNRKAVYVNRVMYLAECTQRWMNTILTREFDSDGAVLSGGEQQKIVAARAFAQKTAVKVFDEPSSALAPYC